MPSHLRVGLLVDSLTQPRWVWQIVHDIGRSDVARIVLVVRNVPQENERQQGTARRAWELRGLLLYRIYHQLDRWMVRGRSNAFELVSIASLVADVPTVDVRPLLSRGGEWFSEADAAAVAGHHPDVLLRFGFGTLRGRILRIPRFGIWEYRDADAARAAGRPAGVWEVIDGDAVTESVLQTLGTDRTAGQVLYRSYSTTSPYSGQANRDRSRWKSATFVLRKLAELHQLGPPALDRAATPAAVAAAVRRPDRPPHNAEMVRGAARIAGRLALAAARSVLLREQWFVAYGFDDGEAPPFDRSFHGFHALVPPPDRLWADPFPVRFGDRYLIFLEEYPYAAGRAHISVVDVSPSGGASAPVPVLERPYHLSYPFVFDWRGDHYIVPEAAESGRVELYRARSFPHDWVWEGVLLDGVRGLDPTLAEIDGRWWMFLNVAPDAAGYGANDELHLYAADTPLGPWRAHPRNPVRSDVRSARPAGRVFEYHGHWYRPSQDSSVRYGYALKFHRITALTESAYAEEEVATVLPTWYPGLLGTHTFNRAGRLTCVDGLVRRRRI